MQLDCNLFVVYHMFKCKVQQHTLSAKSIVLASLVHAFFFPLFLAVYSVHVATAQFKKYLFLVQRMIP